jgi:hypothetical protein
MNSFQKTEGQHRTLYKSGQITQLMNLTIATGFNAYATIPLTGISTRECQIGLFALKHDNYTPASSVDYFSIAKHAIAVNLFTTEFPAAVVGLDCDYQMTNNSLQLGVLNDIGSTLHPIAPFMTLTLSYFVFVF